MSRIYSNIIKLGFAFGLLVISSGCSSKYNTGNYDIVNSNVSSLYENFSSLKFDGQNYYLVGKNKERYNSILYQSLDKQLVNWKLADNDSLLGENKLFYFDKDNLYFVNSGRNDHSKIYSLEKNHGKTFLINSFENTIIKLFCPNLENDSYAIIINEFENGSLYSKRNKLLKIDKTGITKKLELKQNVQKPFYSNGEIYFIGYPDKISKVNTRTFDFDSVQLDGIKISDFKVIGEKDYLILGEQSNKTVLKKYINGRLESLDNFSFSNSDLRGKKLHVYNNFIGILTYSVDKDLLSGFGGATNSLHVSYDNGINWKTIDLPVDYYVNPNMFYKDEKFISYSGGGQFSIIDLRKLENE